MVGMSNDITSLGKKLGRSVWSYHPLTIWSCEFTPRHLPRELKTICPHKDLCTNVQTDSFITAPNWDSLDIYQVMNEQTNCSICVQWCATQQWKGLGYLYLRANMDKFQKHGEWKKSGSKRRYCMIQFAENSRAGILWQKKDQWLGR